MFTARSGSSLHTSAGQSNICLQSSVTTELAEKIINTVCGGTVTEVFFRVLGPPLRKNKKLGINLFCILRSMNCSEIHTLPLHVSHFVAHFPIHFLFYSINTIQTRDIEGHFCFRKGPFPFEGKQAQKPETPTLQDLSTGCEEAKARCTRDSAGKELACFCAWKSLK